MDIVITHATEDDVDRILAAARESDLSYWTRADYTSELVRSDSFFLVAGGKTAPAIGFIVGRLVPAATSDSSVAEINNIAVFRQYRRSGIGSGLIRSFLELAEQKGVKEIWLEVRSGNRAALEFYKNHGFVAFSSRRSYYRDPVEDAIVMRAEL